MIYWGWGKCVLVSRIAIDINSFGMEILLKHEKIIAIIIIVIILRSMPNGCKSSFGTG